MNNEPLIGSIAALAAFDISREEAKKRGMNRDMLELLERTREDAMDILREELQPNKLKERFELVVFGNLDQLTKFGGRVDDVRAEMEALLKKRLEEMNI